MDTVSVVDTVLQIYTVGGGSIDTVTLVDTVHQVTWDTVVVNNFIYDTTVVTVTVVDTVTQTVHHYDTVTVVDTVETNVSLPYAHFAWTALPFHADPLVLEFINAEFGYTEGWIYYLSFAQSTFENPEAGVYDFCGYIDYWLPDFSGYYPLEYCFRMTYVGTDPADPMNWELIDTPASPGTDPGIRLAPERKATMP